MLENCVTELTRVINIALRMQSIPPLPCCCHGNHHMYYRPALNPLFLALIQGQPQKIMNLHLMTSTYVHMSQ